MQEQIKETFAKFVEDVDKGKMFWHMFFFVCVWGGGIVFTQVTAERWHRCFCVGSFVSAASNEHWFSAICFL